MGTGTIRTRLDLLNYRNQLCRDHRQLVEDYKRYAGKSYQPSWELIEDSAKQIMRAQEELEKHEN